MQERRHSTPTPRQSQRNTAGRSTKRSTRSTTSDRSSVYAPKPYAASGSSSSASARRGRASARTASRRQPTGRQSAPSRRSSASSTPARGARRAAPRRRRLFPAIVFGALIVLGIAIVVAFTNPFMNAADLVEGAAHTTQQEAPASSGFVSDGSYPITGKVSLAVDSSELLYENPYNWKNLAFDSHRNFVYQETEPDGRKVILSREGIDVSSHNGTIDWNRVRQDGIDFAIVRLGAHGTTKDAFVVDDTYSRNIVAAKEAGIAVGVYFFSQATTTDEAVTEANFVLDKLGSVSLDYPVFFDFEPVEGDRAYGLTTQQRTAIAEAFCSRIEKAGYTAAIYSSSSDLVNMYNLDRLARYGFWMAQYSAHPTTAVGFAMWQYTDKGHVDGIDGNVDLNLDLTPALLAAEGKIKP